MSVRPPKLLNTKTPVESGASVLDGEIMAEMAASLGRAGRALEAVLLRLDDLPKISDQMDGASHREALLHDAATKAWELIIQYELCGLSNQNNLVRRYNIPAEVMARVGVAGTKI